MNECVRRWKENQPLSKTEIVEMRIGACFRVLLIAGLLVIVALALCGCRSVHASMQQQFDKAKFPAAEVPEDEQTFDGVTIVAAVKELTDYAPEIRKKAALEADRVFRELAERKLPGRVRTRLIAQVAEPYVFNNFEAASMTKASPVLIHVLVPASNRGLTVGLVIKKIEELASAHFLEDLQKYRILVSFQRIDPERYQVGIMAANLKEPPSSTPVEEELQAPPPLPTTQREPRSPEDSPSGGMLATMITAWLTERSKLVAKAVGLYRRFKGLA